MATYLNIAELLVAALLVAVIVLQVRGLGSGLFSSSEATFRTRRGMERVLFNFTIGLVVVFVIISLLSVRFAGY